MSWKRHFSRFLRIALVTAVVLVGIYAVAGFVIAPRVLQNLLVDKAQELFGLEASAGSIRVNPFTLSLGVDDLELKDSAGSRLVALDQLAVQLSTSSVSRRAIILSHVDLIRPHVNVEVLPDSSLNLEPLFHPNLPPSDPTQAKDQPSAGPPRVGVDSIHVTGGGIDLVDRRGNQAFELRLDPLEITLNDFTTYLNESESNSVSATLEDGGRLTWTGAAQKDPGSITGSLELEGLDMNTAWHFLQDYMGFEVREGKLGIEADVGLAYGSDPLGLTLSNGSVMVDSLWLVPKGKDTDLARLEHFELSGLKVDLINHTASAQHVETHGARLLALRNKEGKVESVEYFTLSEQVLNLTAFARGQWKWQLDQFNLTDYQIGWRDETVNLSTQTLTLAISIEEASNDVGHESSVRVQGDVGTGGTIEVEAKAGLYPAAVDASYHVDLPTLDVASIYLGAEFPLSIHQGRLKVDGHFDLGLESTDAYLNLSLDADVSDVALSRGKESIGSLAWDSLKLTDARLALDPDDWTVDRVEVVKPRLELTLSPQPGAPKTKDGDAAGTETSSPDSAASATSPSTAASDTTQATATDDSFDRHLGTVVVTDATVAFVDSTVSPPYKLDVQDLSVTAGGLPGPKGTTQIDVEALLDGRAPLLVTGYLDPAHRDRYTQLTGTLEGYDLMRAQGYSSKYAGWTLKSGALSANLFYTVENRAVDGNNHFQLADLEMGDKVQSSEAQDLPLGTAVPIMKDSHGLIDLNVKVQGDLDDKSFNVGEILVSELTGLVVKVVKLPFQFLGGLVGIQGDDLGWVTFRAGSDSLSSPEQKKLDLLETSLLDHPDVRLEIEGRAFRSQDTFALQEAWLQAQLEAAWQKQNSTKDPDTGTDTPIPLEQRDPLVLGLYRDRFGKSAQDVTPVAAGEQLRATFTVSDEDLQALASRRAQSILTRLLADQRLEKGRLSLGKSSVIADDDQPVQCQLRIHG